VGQGGVHLVRNPDVGLRDRAVGVGLRRYRVDLLPVEQRGLQVCIIVTFFHLFCVCLFHSKNRLD